MMYISLTATGAGFLTADRLRTRAGNATSNNRTQASPTGAGPEKGPELTVIAPTFNERDNVEPLVEKLAETLKGVRWEVIFVDDDLPDGTAGACVKLRGSIPASDVSSGLAGAA